MVCSKSATSSQRPNFRPTCSKSDTCLKRFKSEITQLHSPYIIINDAVVVYRLSVDEGMGYAMMERSTFERRPSTLIQYVLRCHRPAPIGVNNNKVGIITRADITSTVDMKHICRRMSHLFHHFLVCKTAFGYQFKHTRQRMLHQGTTRSCG